MQQQDIPGTIIFDGDQAQKGLALNRMCFSFNSAENRAAFVKDEDAYCRKFGLNDEQRMAVKSRSVLKMIEAGGNVYYFAKLAGIFGLNVQDIGAQQTGMSVEAFKSKLLSAGLDHGNDRRRHRNDARPFDRQSNRRRKAGRSLLEAILQGLRLRPPLADACQTRRRHRVLQRSRAEFLPRQTADLRGRRRRRISQRG